MSAIRLLTESLPDPDSVARPAMESAGSGQLLQLANPEPTPGAAHEQTTQGPHTGRNRFSSLARRAAVVALRAASRIDVPRSTGWNFDWDDNIFNMPTQIRVFHKVTGEIVGISTAEFAIVKGDIGKSGRYAGYERRDPESLAAFGDDPEGKRNFFVEDARRAMAASPDAWQGPSWRAFVRACSRPDTAARTTIITARLHSPEVIHAGLQYLRQIGLLKYVPPAENIFPVSNKKVAERYGGKPENPGPAKALVMQAILDKTQATPLDSEAMPVTTPDGRGKRVMHLWGFSDDDYSNFDKARAALIQGVRAGRWPDVKILVFFTGTNHAGQPPRAEVIMPDGTTRPARSEEAVLVRQRLL